MRNLTLPLSAIALAATALTCALAQQPAVIDDRRIEAVVKASWPKAAPDWQSRLNPDETMKTCSQYRNVPPRAVSNTIQVRERAAIKYPTDGKLMGDWKKGETIAQSGYGQRFTDYPATRENGGNCYACHQLDAREVSYGTVAPSLLSYGKNRKFAEAEVKAVYDKIYNSHASFPCSNMPRFGSNGTLTIEQIKDLVALVMSPDSPVNK
ncbi:MAG: sulfur oxidation c-type cytochrome SoxX [Hyphomicrobiaceae bacterium]|jgi:sulfur-oxidizing protein SoxX